MRGLFEAPGRCVIGKRHASARAGIFRAQADEELREAEARRQGAERERQLLTSYLGTEEQVAGTGRFNVDPNVLKFTQRYNIDERTLLDIQAAGAGIKGQMNPFQSGDNATRSGQDLLTYGRGFANQANDLLAQAEAAARSGDFRRADELYAQAQQIISGVSPEAQVAYNLGGGEESAAAIRASSTEGRIVGRQLLTARELGDANSRTSTELRGRLLDPALAAVDENTRNAERAITAERSEIEGQIRQQSASGGTGVNARADLALRSQAASQAALQRAVTFSDAGTQRAVLTAQVNQYLNEFSKRMAEDSVRIAQAWVDGTAGVRDEFQDALTQLNVMSADLANQWARFAALQAEKRRDEDKRREALRREFVPGVLTGTLALASIFGGTQNLGTSTGQAPGQQPGGGVGFSGSNFGSVGSPGGASTRIDPSFAPGVGEASDVGNLVGSGAGGGMGGGGGFGKILGSLFSFL